MLLLNCKRCVTLFYGVNQNPKSKKKIDELSLLSLRVIDDDKNSTHEFLIHPTDYMCGRKSTYEKCWCIVFDDVANFLTHTRRDKDHGP